MKFFCGQSVSSLPRCKSSVQGCLGNVMTQVSAGYLLIENVFSKIYLLCHMSLQCTTENVIIKKKCMFFSIVSVYVWTPQLRIYIGTWSREL